MNKRTVVLRILGILLLVAFGFLFQKSTNGWGIPLVLLVAAMVLLSGGFGDRARIYGWIVIAVGVVVCIALIVRVEGGRALAEYRASQPTPTPVQCAGLLSVEIAANTEQEAKKGVITIVLVSDGTKYIGFEYRPGDVYIPRSTAWVYQYPTACRDYVDSVLIPSMYFPLASYPTSIPTAIPTNTPITTQTAESQLTQGP